MFSSAKQIERFAERFWCVCKFFCDIRLFTYKHIFPAAISPVEGISPDEYILSFDCSIQFPPDTDNQARKSCWDTEHLRHPCCRTSADRQEHSRQRRRLWQRKRLLTSRKTVTQNLSWNFFLINVVQWVQSAISFIFVHLSLCTCLVCHYTNRINPYSSTSVKSTLTLTTISFPIPAPVHCDSFAFTLVFVSQNSVTLAPPSCTLTDGRNARRVICVRLHLSVTVCKLLLDNRASFTTTNESPQTTLWHRWLHWFWRGFLAPVISSTQWPTFSKFLSGRSAPAVFQIKVVFWVTVEIPTQPVDFTHKTLRHSYLNETLTIPLDLNSHVGHKGYGKTTLRYLKIRQMIVW